MRLLRGFRLDDGFSFVHIASIDTLDGSNPLRSISAFAEPGRETAERCERTARRLGLAARRLVRLVHVVGLGR
jgi:hypothetical protein